MNARIRRHRSGATVFYGADPGKSGAIAAITTDSGQWGYRWIRMPTVGKAEWRMDYSMLKHFVVKTWDDWTPNCHGTIEKVHSMPRDGVRQAFSFGRCREALEASFTFLEVPYEMVPPQTWKKHFQLLKKPKEDSIALAQRFFPELQPRNDTKAAMKELEGPAEALLIARYGWERFR